MADTAPEAAFNPDAPAGERYDAQAELNRIYRPLASSLIPASDVQAFIADLEGQADLLKAASGNVVNFPGRVGPPPTRGMRSVYVDDLQIFANGEYFEKPNPIGFDGLRQMVEQTPILNAVVLTRIRQVSRFCSMSEDGGPGFEIRHIDRKHKLTGCEQESAKLLARFFQNSGWEFHPRRRKALKRDNLQGFMAKSIRDSLTMDASPIETEPKRDRSLGIDGFYAVDGTTIRLCSEDGYDGNDKIFALQVVQGRLATAYTLDQLIYEVRNPRADVRLAGYGLGEPELLIRVVTGFLNAMTYNIAGFDQNAIPKGLLHLSGDYSTEDLSAFKRYWNSMVQGVNNAWSLPVMVSKDQESKATFERFGIEFNEMYFSKWMTFLTSIVCSIYGMDPAEINFESFSASKSSLSGSDTEERLAEAKDKGLRPLMAFYESMFSDFIVSEFNPDFCFRWVGLDEEDQDKLLEKQKLILRVDELRAELGYEPDSEYGDAPLNPALVGAWQMKKQAEMQPQQPAGDFGQPDDGAADGEPVQMGGQPQQDASGDQGEPDQGGEGGEFGGAAGDGEFGAKSMRIWKIGE